MKKLAYILCIVLTGVLSACQSHDEDDGGGTQNPTGSKGLMTIEVVGRNADATAEDYLHTARFIVFDNASTTRPSLDLNERIPVKESDKNANKFSITLETSKNADKMIVLILNEPEGLSGTLAGINRPDALEELHFEFAQILNNDHATLLETGMPMSGVIWAGSSHGRPVYETQAEAEQNRFEMEVERAVARVDFWLEAVEEGAVTGYTSGLTRVTLANTYTTSYLAMGNTKNGTRNNTVTPARNYGFMQTVDPAVFVEPGNPKKTWTAGSTKTVTYSSAPNAENKVLACSFYTAERTCSAPGDADKLKLELENVIKGVGGTADGTFTIATMTPQGGGTPLPFTQILRNNVYEITASVSKKGIEIGGQVLDWNDAPINTGLGKSDYLTVSDHDLTVRNITGKNQTGFILRTDESSWSARLYDNAACTVPMTDGWLTLNQTSGGTTTAGTEVIATLKDRTTRTGYVKVTAGRMSLVVKISRGSIALEFAKSNVVSMDNGATATFAGTEQDYENKGIPANMQGLFFKWGSLVGTGSQGTDNVNASVWFNKTGTIYSTWNSIPYASSGFDYTGTYDRDAFINFNNGTGFNAGAGTGDICRYISAMGWVSGNWRIPTAEEWVMLWNETLNHGIGYGVTITSENVNNTYGRYLTQGGIWYGAAVTASINNAAVVDQNRKAPPEGTVFLPASGFRDPDSGKSKGPGSFGFYWGSVSRYQANPQVRSAYHLRFDYTRPSDTNGAAYSSFRAVGNTIRCIRVD